MTWTKLSDDFADDCARVKLSDAAFRTHVDGLLWTMRRETGGHLDAIAVRRFAESPEAADGIRELVECGFWQIVPGGYLVLHHMEHQPEPEILAARREAEADRQRRWREKALSRRDETRDETRHPGRDGSGRVGTGKASTVESDKDAHARAPAHARTHARAPARDDETNGGYLGGPVDFASGSSPQGSSETQACHECGSIDGFALLAGRCRTCHFGEKRSA